MRFWVGRDAHEHAVFLRKPKLVTVTFDGEPLRYWSSPGNLLLDTGSDLSAPWGKLFTHLRLKPFECIKVDLRRAR